MEATTSAARGSPSPSCTRSTRRAGDMDSEASDAREASATAAEALLLAVHVKHCDIEGGLLHRLRSGGARRWPCKVCLQRRERSASICDCNDQTASAPRGVSAEGELQATACSGRAAVAEPHLRRIAGHGGSAARAGAEPQHEPRKLCLIASTLGCRRISCASPGMRSGGTGACRALSGAQTHPRRKRFAEATVAHTQRCTSAAGWRTAARSGAAHTAPVARKQSGEVPCGERGGGRGLLWSRDLGSRPS